MRAIVCALGILVATQPGVPRYDVYAVRFAHVPYAESSLVAGAAKGPQVDIAFTIWPIVDASSARVILVDAGFYRDKFMASWKPQDYVRPSVALQAQASMACRLGSPCPTAMKKLTRRSTMFPAKDCRWSKPAALRPAY